MFENPLPVMDFEHTYIHIASICALTKRQKIKENATPIEESSGEIIENQRKRYPYRGIVVCN